MKKIIFALFLISSIVLAKDVALTITLTGEFSEEVVSNFADATGWTALDKDGKPNPVSKQEYSEARLQDYVKNVVRNYLAQKHAQEEVKKSLEQTDSKILFK